MYLIEVHLYNGLHGSLLCWRS